MSNTDKVVEQWAHGVIVNLHPVLALLAKANPSDADVNLAVKTAHAELAHHSFFGINLQRLFDLEALEAHLRGLLGEKAPAAPEPAPEAQETPETGTPEAPAPTDPASQPEAEPDTPPSQSV